MIIFKVCDTLGYVFRIYGKFEVKEKKISEDLSLRVTNAQLERVRKSDRLCTNGRNFGPTNNISTATCVICEVI